MGRSRSFIAVFVVVASAAVACSAVLGIEDTTDDPIGGSGADGGGGIVDTSIATETNDSNTTQDTGNALPDGGDIVDPADADIQLPEDGGDGDGAAPPPDAGCYPTTTFAPATGATGTVCYSSSILPGNSGSTGLDFTNNEQKLATIADKYNVTSCIGVTFGKAITSFTIRASSTPKACNRDCVGSFCGTGHTATVFAVTTGGKFTYLKTLQLTSSYATFNITLPASLSGAVTQVFACRSGWSGERDDVAISYITGQCVP